MSHIMTALAMKQRGLKPATKIVLYWLADHYNGETGDCYPSINRLAQVCEMSRRSVQMQIDTLQELGLVQVSTRSRENNSQTSNGYILRLKETDGYITKPNEGVKNLHGGDAKSALGAMQNLHPHNLGNNNQGSLTIFDQRRANLLASDRFEEIWSIYPRKVGKGAAKTSFQKALKRISAEQLRDKIAAYSKAVAGTDQKFIPHLSTWLNQERWADDLPTRPSVDTGFRDMVNDLARVTR